MRKKNVCADISYNELGQAGASHPDFAVFAGVFFLSFFRFSLLIFVALFRFWLFAFLSSFVRFVFVESCPLCANTFRFGILLLCNLRQPQSKFYKVTTRLCAILSTPLLFTSSTSDFSSSLYFIIYFIFVLFEMNERLTSYPAPVPFYNSARASNIMWNAFWFSTRMCVNFIVLTTANDAASRSSSAITVESEA